MQVSWRLEQTCSTSYQPRLPVLTTHTVLPGPINLWSLFPRTYFFLPGAFFRKTFSDRKQGASLRPSGFSPLFLFLCSFSVSRKLCDKFVTNLNDLSHSQSHRIALACPHAACYCTCLSCRNVVCLPYVLLYLLVLSCLSSPPVLRHNLPS